VAYTTVFVISGDSAIRDSLLELIAAAGLRAETFSSLERWFEAIQPEREGCIVLDASSCDFIGSGRLGRFASLCARRPVLLLIDRGDMPVAVCALKDGARDVLEKPYRDRNLIERIKRVAAVRPDANANK